MGCGVIRKMGEGCRHGVVRFGGGRIQGVGIMGNEWVVGEVSVGG